MKSRWLVVFCCFTACVVTQVMGAEPERLGEKEPPPKLLEKVNPVYPAEAKEKGIQGPVTLDALINEAGDVVEVKIVTDKERVTQPPDPILAKAAVEAVKQWKYEPYRDASGKVKSVRFSVTINFKLK